MKQKNNLSFNDLENSKTIDWEENCDMKLYDKIFDYVEETLSYTFPVNSVLITDCIYCYNFLKANNVSDIVIVDTLASIKARYLPTKEELSVINSSSFWNTIRQSFNLFGNQFTTLITNTHNKKRRINISKSKIGKVERKIDHNTSQYFSIKIIDLSKFYTNADFELLKQLDIHPQNRLYTGFELEQLGAELIEYYDDDPTMTEDDLQYIKDLKETGVSKDNYYNLLDKYNKLYSYYIY